MISLLSERTHTQNILESRFYLAGMQKRMIDNEIGQVTFKTAILQLETVHKRKVKGESLEGQICKANLQTDKKRKIRELSKRVTRRKDLSYTRHSCRFTMSG